MNSIKGKYRIYKCTCYLYMVLKYIDNMCIHTCYMFTMNSTYYCSID